jgi:hypothetical protein
VSGAIQKPARAWRTALLGASLIALYAGWSSLWVWSPKRGLGLALGVLAASLLVFEVSYPLRRALLSGPFGTAEEWLRKHVYWGALAPLLVFLHAGGLPHGAMGWWLFGLTAWVTASGLVGVLLRKWIPVRLAEQLAVEASYERIPDMVADLKEEAEAVVLDSSDRVQDFYHDALRTRLAAVRPFSLELVLDVQAGRERELRPFRNMVRYLEEADRAKVEVLAALYTRKMELDAHHSNQAFLRGWLIWTLHVPASGLLVGVLAIHVLTWVWF